MANKGKGAMTVREAGQKGGETTKERYGEEFYEQIGRRGGKIGGETTKERYGGSFYEDIGHKGGQKVKELIERGKSLRGGQ
jgi:general stress protein YciG